VLLVYCTTDALPAIVLPVIQQAKVPIFLLNIQPKANLNYERINATQDAADKTGEWLAHCGACPVPKMPMYCGG
jgi:L-arabinose isomerase